MQCYTDLIPPSGVTGAVWLPFLSETASNLVVAKTSVLQILTHRSTDNGQGTKLVHVAEYRLSGTISSLARVSILNSKSGGDALLIAFRDAKLSLVEWDPDNYSLSTISIHYYEGEELQRCPWGPDPRDAATKLTIEPDSRCAAFHFGSNNLAIIPFHQAGDDLVMEDYDSLDDEKPNNSVAKQDAAENSEHQTPYGASFVLPLTALDPGVVHPVNLAFLYEYRRSTIGVLYSSAARAPALINERKDITTYSVFTLDLEQKSSTTLLQIQKLPNDLFKVIPLPPPVGGSLLVGTNEFVHVDQGGKVNSIAVNELAKEASSHPMSDQSSLCMRLEGCQLEQLGTSTGDLLIILQDGGLAILSFRLDGRTVSGLLVRQVPVDTTKDLIQTAASCICAVGVARIFVGSDSGDSVLLGTVRKTSALKKHSSHANLAMDTVKEESVSAEGDEEDEEDDLYDEIPSKTSTNQQTDLTYSLASSMQVLDRLPGLGPLRDITVGRLKKRKRDQGEVPDRLELAAASGEGRAGCVTIMNKSMECGVMTSMHIENSENLWTIDIREGDQSDKLSKCFAILSTLPGGTQESSLYSISGDKFAIHEDTEFNLSGRTIEAAALGGTKTVQVLESEIRVYNSGFGLSQIWPIVDEDEGTTDTAISAHVSGPYVVVLKSNLRLLVLKADKKGELDEVDLPDRFEDLAFLSVNVYQDHGTLFESSKTSTRFILVCLTNNAELYLFDVEKLTKGPLYHLTTLSFLPPVLGNQVTLPKHWRYTDDGICEALIGNIGHDSHPHCYLFVRTKYGDICIYEPFSPGVPEPSNIKFRRLGARRVTTKVLDTTDQSTQDHAVQAAHHMHLLKTNIETTSMFVPGAAPSIIVHSDVAGPEIHSLNLEARQPLASTDTGHLSISSGGALQILRLPSDVQSGYGEWLVRRHVIGEDVSHVAFSERTNTYVLATEQQEDFQLPQDDEWHQEWRGEQSAFLPTIAQGSLKLLDPSRGQIVSTYDFEPCERAMCIKSINLEVSEETHERKDLLVVGTTLIKGENVTARGHIYIFDIADIVPVPEKEEPDLKLKLICKDEVKGAVTAVSSIGTQGFIITAQGQKCMVRGLKENMSTLPVAFMDMRYYVNVIKELPGTGLTLMGDAMQGLWLTAYSEEPYKLLMLGKDQHDMDVLTADFLPDGNQLYIVAADGNGEMHVLQFDPENPKSERGTKLLHRSTFNTGSFPTTMTLLPQSLAVDVKDEADNMDIDEASSRSQIIVTTREGGLALITPLSEDTYRRLSTLQNILTANTDHPCGLNPRAYRAAETDGIGGRAIIDGSLVQRWIDQSSHHKASLADKVGGTIYDIKRDLELISGGALSYL